MKFGSVVHYKWMDYRGDDIEPVHSASMYIGPSARSPLLEFVQLPLSDTSYQFGLTSPIVAKSVAAWEICGATCPFNPDYEGDPS